MRHSCLSGLLFLGFLLSVPATTHAERRPGRHSPAAAWQSAATQHSDRLGAHGDRAASGTEQQVMARVRGYKSQLEREEKMLSQRLAYAGQLRQQGLEKKDPRLLDQAEQYERKALAAYQQRVKRFERTNLNPEANGGGPASVNRAKPANDSKSIKNLPSTTGHRTRRRSSRRRSSKSAKSVWNWLR